VIAKHSAADRGISHFAHMWIALGIAVLLIVLLSASFWLPRQLQPGPLPVSLAISSLPFLFAYAAYQSAAWRAQSAVGVKLAGRSIAVLRVASWLSGAAGLLWWGMAADWLLSLLVTVVLFVLLLILTASITGWAHHSSRRIWPDVTACIGLMILVASAAVTAWPLRLTFLASRAQLEALATRVEAGQTIEAPLWVGVFRIARTEIRPPGWRGGTCLWVFSHPGHPTGLVRSDRPDGPGVNVNRSIRLSEHWYYISED
jgi:hypothetical protein